MAVGDVPEDAAVVRVRQNRIDHFGAHGEERHAADAGEVASGPVGDGERVVGGALGDDAVGAYAYEKLTDRGYPAPCEVLVFPLNATFQLLDWKERGQRSIRWLPIAEAADIAADRPLARLLTELAAAPARLGPPRF